MHYKNNAETSTSDWIRLNFDAVHGPFIAHAIGDDYDALERIGRPEEPEIEEPIEPEEPERPEPEDGMSAKDNDVLLPGYEEDRKALDKELVEFLDVLERIGRPEEPERPEPEDGMSAKDYDVLLQAYELEKSIWDKAMIEYLAAQKAYDDAWREYEEARENFENLHGFPVAWNQMWTPTDPKLRGSEIDALIESGFVVYDTRSSNIDFGFDYVFGVDGGGYSFYEAHWRPLRARLSRILAIRYHSNESVANHNELVGFLASEERGGSGPNEDFIREFSL